MHPQTTHLHVYFCARGSLKCMSKPMPPKGGSCNGGSPLSSLCEVPRRWPIATLWNCRCRFHAVMMNDLNADLMSPSYKLPPRSSPKPPPRSMFAPLRIIVCAAPRPPMRTLSRVGVGGRGVLRIPQFVHRTYRRSRHIDVSFQILFVYENGGVHHRNCAASLVFFYETGNFQRMYHSAYIYVCAPWLTRYYLELGQKGSNIIWPTSAYGMEGAEKKIASVSPQNGVVPSHCNGWGFSATES